MKVTKSINPMIGLESRRKWWFIWDNTYNLNDRYLKLKALEKANQ